MKKARNSPNSTTSSRRSLPPRQPTPANRSRSLELIIDLSKFGSGTDNSGGGSGKVSFVLMRCSRLMTGLNVGMALSKSSIRSLGASKGVLLLNALAEGFETFLLCRKLLFLFFFLRDDCLPFIVSFALMFDFILGFR